MGSNNNYLTIIMHTSTQTPPELIKFVCSSKAGMEFLPPRPKTEKNKNIIVRACLSKCVCVEGTFMARRKARTLFYDFLCYYYVYGFLLLFEGLFFHIF